MEIVINQTREPVDKNTDINKIFIELGKTILEQIYSQTLDYQSLIDSHFRYLYNQNLNGQNLLKLLYFIHCSAIYQESNKYR